jgi:hypothetical protein
VVKIKVLGIDIGKEIWKDIKGKLKTAGGYIWKYLEV